MCFYLKVPHEQSKFGSLPRFFKRWMALSIGQISIQWIKIRETDYVIHWKEIYLVDSVIHLSKNWALVVCYTAVFRVVTRRSSPGGGLRDDSKNGCVSDYQRNRMCVSRF